MSSRGAWDPWRERRADRRRRWRSAGIPTWLGQLYLVGLLGGTAAALYTFREDHWLGWVAGVFVGWVVGLPVVNALILRRFRGPEWPPW